MDNYFDKIEIISHAPVISITFDEGDVAMIKDYMRAVEANNLRDAVMNAVSVAMDALDEPTEETHCRFNEFSSAQDALQPLLARFK